MVLLYIHKNILRACFYTHLLSNKKPHRIILCSLFHLIQLLLALSRCKQDFFINDYRKSDRINPWKRVQGSVGNQNQTDVDANIVWHLGTESSLNISFQIENTFKLTFLWKSDTLRCTHQWSYYACHEYQKSLKTYRKESIDIKIPSSKYTKI